MSSLSSTPPPTIIVADDDEDQNRRWSMPSMRPSSGSLSSIRQVSPNTVRKSMRPSSPIPTKGHDPSYVSPREQRLNKKHKTFRRHSLLDSRVPEEECMTHLPVEEVLRKRSTGSNAGTKQRRHGVVTASPVLVPPRMTRRSRSDECLPVSIMGQLRRHASEERLPRSPMSRSPKLSSKQLEDDVVCVKCGSFDSCCSQGDSLRLARDRLQPLVGSLRRLNLSDKSSLDSKGSLKDSSLSDDGYCEDEQLLAEMEDVFSEEMLTIGRPRTRTCPELDYHYQTSSVSRSRSPPSGFTEC